MNIRQRIANFFDPTHENSGGVELARDFLRYGPQRGLVSPDWSQAIMGERDKYTGFLYGATTRRANKVAMLAKFNLRTKANAATADAAKKDKKEITHPYLTAIDLSTQFENDLFWRAMQTWIDLRGVSYLIVPRGRLMVRDKAEIGAVKTFELAWPNEITPVRDLSNMEIIGYTQNVGGMMRDLPPHMVIMTKNFNPLSRSELFSMSDAAMDAQFTLKESTAGMRLAARRNRKYPGVVMLQGGDVGLDPEQASNFKATLRGKSNTDEPLFAKAGLKGGLAWQDMQIDVRKSAVDLVNRVNLQELIAVTGMSLTKFGIEQSGVTRDSSETQDEQFTTDHAMPAFQTILDALNQDYKTNYPDDYAKYGYEMVIESPQGEDRDAVSKDIENRSAEFDLYTTLVAAGYTSEIAADYAIGDKDLKELGAPTESKTNEPATPATSPAADDKQPPAPPTAPKDKKNALAPSDNPTVKRAKAGLQSAVIDVQRQLVTAVITKVRRNDFQTTDDIVDDDDRTKAEKELNTAIGTFYEILVPLAGAQTMSERIATFGLIGRFSMDQEAKQYIKVTAARASSGHVDTVLGDILQTVKDTQERLIQGAMKKVDAKPGQTPEEILAAARKLALDGNGRNEIARQVRQTYEDQVSKLRATTIARTETNRAYNRAQYEADRQFLAQNKLTDRAYKKWITRSDNPCPYCKAKAAEPAVPFTQAFATEGQTISATFTKADGSTSIRQMVVGFEDCQAGEIHPNGECTYEIEIREEE